MALSLLSNGLQASAAERQAVLPPVRSELHVPRYYFHVTDSRDYPDLQGTLLDDVQAARTEAVRFSGRLLEKAADTFWEGQEWHMRVTDDADLTLFTLLFVGTDGASKNPGANSRNLKP
jgi:hypothetical protein